MMKLISLVKLRVSYFIIFDYIYIYIYIYTNSVLYPCFVLTTVLALSNKVMAMYERARIVVRTKKLGSTKDQCSVHYFL